MLASSSERQNSFKPSILAVRWLHSFQSRVALCYLVMSHTWPCYSLWCGSQADILNGKETRRFVWARKTRKFWKDSEVIVMEWSLRRDRKTIPPFMWQLDQTTKLILVSLLLIEFLRNYRWASEVITLTAVSLLHSLSTTLSGKVLTVTPTKTCVTTRIVTFKYINVHFSQHNCHACMITHQNW